MAAINTYAVTSSTAAAFRALNKYGMNLADFAALTTNSSFTGFGNGTGYTVSNWISDGVFANLAAVQAVYPIVQSGTDKVDWVLLQSAADFLIYGALGNSIRGQMKRKLLIPAGHFVMNRPLHLGYGLIGTPPANLNGGGYISITLQGEGRQVDPSGNGITGTTIITESYTHPGLVLHGYLSCQLKDFTLKGPGYSWMENNAPYSDDDNWNVSAWRDPAITADANWIGGAAVNIGIGLDIYTHATSAAAYPARVLPSYFGGGTTTAQFGTSGGSVVEMEGMHIAGFVIGVGRPHGDANGEFIRIHNTDISRCVYGLTTGHSQNRNVSVTNVNFELMHTALTSRGGLTGNANMHGTYSNIHIGRCFQILNHPAGDWSGPLTLRDIYAESFFRIGTFDKLIIDGGALSSLDQEGTHGSVYNWFDGGNLILRNTDMTGREGLFTSPVSNVSITLENVNWQGGAGVLTDLNAQLGVGYMNNMFGSFSNRSLTGVFDGSKTAFGRTGYGGGDGSSNSYTSIDQLWADYMGPYPSGVDHTSANSASAGSHQRFPVPKIGRRQVSLTVSSRSGLDLTCPRIAVGDCKADLGDIFAVETSDADPTLEGWDWFAVHSISGGNMILRQLNNFAGDSQFDYRTNGRAQVTPGGYSDAFHYICTRIRRNFGLIVGDVTSGSNVITNVKYAYSGSGSGLTTSLLTMVAGDYFIHQEIERANAGGSILKNLNLVSAIDIGARTITLTDNFNITQTNYPVVFYVKVFNA